MFLVLKGHGSLLGLTAAVTRCYRLVARVAVWSCGGSNSAKGTSVFSLSLVTWRLRCAVLQALLWRMKRWYWERTLWGDAVMQEILIRVVWVLPLIRIIAWWWETCCNTTVAMCLIRNSRNYAADIAAFPVSGYQPPKHELEGKQFKLMKHWY